MADGPLADEPTTRNATETTTRGATETTTRDAALPAEVTVPDRVYLPDDGIDLGEVGDPDAGAGAVAGDTAAVTGESPDIGVVIDELLDEIYAGQERVTQAEIHRRAVAAELPADVLIRITAMPEGEYAIDEAAEHLGAREAR